MEITKNTLEAVSNQEEFVKFYTAFSQAILGEARFYPKLALPRVIEAHGAWQNDLRRVGNHEPKLDDGLDHFKRCGHLAFWVRRMSPIVEVHDLTTNLGDAEGYPLSLDEKAFRNLLFAYCNEYVAFDLGYQICRFYEIAKEGGSDRANGLTPTEDFYRTQCHFMKYKNVSPHALFLIYKAMFLT